MFAFYGVGDGREFCLDTNSVAADREMPVVCAYLGGDEREEIASDFGSAFLILVREELGDEDAE